MTIEEQQSRGEEKYVKSPPLTAVTVLEKMEKTGEITHQSSKQREDNERISFDPKNEQLEQIVNTDDPKSKGENEYGEVYPPTSVKVLEKMEKTGEVTRLLSKQREDLEKISLDPENEQIEWIENTEEPKSKVVKEYDEISPPTSVKVLEKMEKTGEVTRPLSKQKEAHEKIVIEPTNEQLELIVNTEEPKSKTKVMEIVNEYERSQENIASSVVRTIEEQKKETEQSTLAIKNNFDVEASKFSSNQKIREVFHMDVAEIIIEREQQRS